MTEILNEKLSGILERDLTEMEKAIVEWVVIQVEIENSKEVNA